MNRWLSFVVFLLLQFVFFPLAVGGVLLVAYVAYTGFTSGLI